VANADQLLIVASWQDPALWPELIDRYLITAERNGLVPIICVNKVDLAKDIRVCQDKLDPYINLGYRVLFTSALEGLGLKKLHRVLTGHLTALAGLSGVGKSSLLVSLQPDLALRVSEVSDYSHAGRHTTTQVNLMELEGGGRVVDTPGIREFGLDGLRRGELVGFYPEILAVANRCAFRDCSHIHEPGCAVRAALETGLVSTMRYKNYGKIYDTLPD
jgi:ribosome biogenesis GTPase